MPSGLTKDDAARLGRKVSELLRGYIEAQNSLFKFSFATAFGLRQPDPASGAAAAAGLKGEVEALLEEVREAKLDPAEKLDSFFITLRPYLRSVIDAMTFFTDFCGRMIAAKNAKNKKYWKESYKKDLEQLQQMERAYLEIGLELNRRWKEIA